MKTFAENDVVGVAHALGGEAFRPGGSWNTCRLPPLPPPTDAAAAETGHVDLRWRILLLPSSRDRSGFEA